MIDRFPAHPRPLTRLAVVAACLALAAACSGVVGPTPLALPLESIELTGVPAKGTVGDRFPLKVIATNVHGGTEEVTSSVTWTSSSEATATVVNAELVMVGVGQAEIRASLESTASSSTVAVEARPPGRSTLSGLVRDSATQKGVPSAIVQVADGANAGQSALTDESGFYSLPALIQGNVRVRVIRSGYETMEATTALSADVHLDILIKALPPPPFTGASFDVRVTVAPNRCQVDLPSTGRLVLSGSPRRLTIRVEQGIATRQYDGSLESDGTFIGSTGLAGLHAGDPDVAGHGISTIKGLIVDSEVAGTEKIATHLCPNGLGIVNAGFTGTQR